MPAKPEKQPKKWLLILPIVIAIAVLFFLMKNRAEPEQAQPTEQTRAVRIITVPKLTVIPRATGYGSVVPGKTWDSVVEVNGRITEVHPQLKNGELVQAGAVLIRIDATDYELAAVQVED